MNKVYEINEVIVTSNLNDVGREALKSDVEIRVYLRDIGEFLTNETLSDEVLGYIEEIKQSRVDEYNNEDTHEYR